MTTERNLADLPSPELVKQRVLSVIETTIGHLSTSENAMGQFGTVLGLAGALNMAGLMTMDEYEAVSQRAKDAMPRKK